VLACFACFACFACLLACLLALISDAVCVDAHRTHGSIDRPTDRRPTVATLLQRISHPLRSIRIDPTESGRQAGLGRLLDGETKPPTRKEEAWRFTDLGKLYGKRHVQPPQVLQKEQAAAVATKVEEHSLEVCAGRVMVREV
jgi:hypothetical protein